MSSWGYGDTWHVLILHEAGAPAGVLVADSNGVNCLKMLIIDNAELPVNSNER